MLGRNASPTGFMSASAPAPAGASVHAQTRVHALSRAAVASLAAAALFGGCRDATTGPSHVQSKDFASALRSVSGDQQIGSVGGALTQQLVVKVVDAGGQPVEGATVTFFVRGGGGSVNPPANTSSSTGIVSATWTLGTALGANKVVAVLTNNFVLDSATFTATATSAAPSVITLVSGNAQRTRVGQSLAQALVVKVTDQYGYAVSGTRVTWTPGLLSGTVTPPNDTTSADGTAQTIWTLGTTQVAQQTVTAAVAGAAPVIFTATSQPDTVRIVTPVAGSGQSASVSAALPTTISVNVTDQFGNPIAGDTVTWADSISGGGKVSPAKSVTSSAGVALTTWTLGTRAGTQVMRVKSQSGLTALYTATATVAFSEIFSGNFQACGIVASNQQAYCWGAGDAGQLAKGSLTNANAPTTPVATVADSLNGPFLQVRQLAGGRNSYCALTVARQMYCWGRTIGQSSVTANIATLQTVVMGSTNQQILPNFIAAGEQHICLIDLAGQGFCTGVNLHGELGDGTGITPNLGTYSFIASPPVLWSTISAGRNHACGLPRYSSDATQESQRPRCWGFNSTGQVGNNTTTAAATGVLSPKSITMPVVGVTAFDSLTITTGAQHSCAIAVAPVAAVGTAYCWGNNGFGQLGRGGAISGVGLDSVAAAVAAPAGVIFVKLYAGEYHTCGISTTGAAYCWGRNDYGQLGDGTRASQSAPVAVTGGLAFRSLSLGEIHTCGLVAPLGTPGSQSSQPGTMYCWGDNVFGQIGNGTTGNNTPALAPTRVAFQP